MKKKKPLIDLYMFLKSGINEKDTTLSNFHQINQGENSENKVVVLCRTKEDVEIVYDQLANQVSNAEFICFTIASYVEARNRQLKAIPLKQYCDLGSQTFAYQSVDLTRGWLAAVLDVYSYPKEDIINSLIYPLHIFFRTILFAKSIIPEIIKYTNPSKVILCAKWPLPNIQRDNQETIFAYACQDYLNQNNIDNSIIFTRKVNESLGIKKKVLFFLKQFRFFKPFLRNNVFLINLSYFLQPHKFIIAYLLLIKLTVLKSIYKKPQIIMCGAGTDAVFQGELVCFWNKIRDWELVRFESDRNSDFRRKVRDTSQIKPGIDMSLLDFLGLGPKIANRNLSRLGMLNRHYDWSKKNIELSSFLTNQKLGFQFEAMVDFVRQEINSINLFCSAFEKIKPDLVLTHNMNAPIIAARQSNIKSCSQKEGIGFDWFPMDPLIGDVIAVPGELNIHNVKKYNFWLNNVWNVGAYFVNKNSKFSNRDTSTINHSSGKQNLLPKIIFLVPCLTIEFQYLIEDIESLINTIKILTLAASSDTFELVLKFHPRYGQYSIYQDVIDPYEIGSNVKFSNDPNYQSLMNETDLVVFIETSGAVIETLFAGKPLLWLSYLSPQRDDDTYSFDFFNEYIQKVDSCSVLLETITNIITVESMLNKILKKQEIALPQILSSYGIEAAEQLALACDSLIPNKKLPPNAGNSI